MPFFKKEETDILQAPNFVMGPDFELKAEEKDTYTYPVDGWYWFDTLDEAILAFSKLITNPDASTALSITSRQGKLAMLTYPTPNNPTVLLLDSVEQFIAAIPDPLQKRKAEIEYNGPTWEVTSPFLQAIWQQFGGTPEQLTQLFHSAKLL